MAQASARVRVTAGPGPRSWLAPAIAAGVALLSAVPRLALAAGALPSSVRPFVWSDLLDSYGQLLAGGRIPYWDTVFYYPPLVGYAAGLFARVSHDALGYLALWSVLIAIGASVVALVLARSAGVRPALVYWAAAPQLLLHAGTNFDVLPTAALIVATVLLRTRRNIRALAVLAVGTLTKVFPVVAVPLELDRLRGDRRRLLMGAVTFGAVGLVLAIPSVVGPFPSTSFAPDYAGRTNWDSFWGLLEGVASLRITSSPPIVAVTTLGLLTTYVLAVVPAARRSRDPAVGVALAVVTLLLWTRLYSPQYSLWILPFFALLAIPIRWFVILTLADVVVFFTVYPLTLTEWAGNEVLPTVLLAILVAAVTLRQAVLVFVWLALRRLAIGPVAGTARSGR